MAIRFTPKPEPSPATDKSDNGEKKRPDATSADPATSGKSGRSKSKKAEKTDADKDSELF